MTMLTQKTTDILGTDSEKERMERRALCLAHTIVGALIADGAIIVDYADDQWAEHHRNAVETVAATLINSATAGILL